MIKNAFLLLIIVTVTLFSFSTYNAYADVFLKIDSIPGDVTAQGFQNDIQIDSFHFGSTRTISSPTGTGDRTAGAPSVSDLDITKLMEKSSV
ncbi:MAG TPA: type VI secretion system tube protein Hcp, partial [Nitrosopumilaceae archaeon]|nr:type VI secretion system tube protein Hcp [Nitrosopumilaceae archaeon]